MLDDDERDLFVTCVTELALENKGEVCDHWYYSVYSGTVGCPGILWCIERCCYVSSSTVVGPVKP